MTKISAAVVVAASLGFATGIAAVGTLTAPHAAWAADAKPDKSKQLSPKMKPLIDAVNLMKAGKLQEAIAKGQEADKVAGKTPYETHMVDTVLISLYVTAKDYPNAIKYMEADLTTGQMTPEEETKATKQIASSYYAAKNWAKVIEYGTKAIKDDPNDPEMVVLVAQANYLQNNYKATSEGIHQAMRLAQAAGKPVKADWLNLLMSSESQLGNQAGIESALEQLIPLDPKPDYWKNLVAYYQRDFGTNTTPKTELDIDNIKLQVGLLAVSNDYMNMAQLALQDGLPGLAKSVMDKGLKSGVLGNDAQKDREMRLSTMANTQADGDQKGLAANETEARKAKNGDPMVKLGEAYWSYGQFDKAVDAIQAGITKGVDNQDDAKLRLGIVYLSSGKRQQAADAFKSITPGSLPAKLGKLWMLASTSPPKQVAQAAPPPG